MKARSAARCSPRRAAVTSAMRSSGEASFGRKVSKASRSARDVAMALDTVATGGDSIVRLRSNGELYDRALPPRCDAAQSRPPHRAYSALDERSLCHHEQLFF